MTQTAAKLTAAQRKALTYFATGAGEYPHGGTINKLTERGLLEEKSAGLAWERQITAAGRAAL